MYRKMFASLFLAGLLCSPAFGWPCCKWFCKPCKPAPCPTVWIYRFETMYFHAPLPLTIGDDPREIQRISLEFRTDCTGYITFDGTKYDGPIDVWGEPTGTPAPGVYPPMPCTFHMAKMPDPAGKGRRCYKVDIGIDSEMSLDFFFISDPCEWHRDCRLVAVDKEGNTVVAMALER